LNAREALQQVMKERSTHQGLVGARVCRRTLASAVPTGAATPPRAGTPVQGERTTSDRARRGARLEPPGPPAFPPRGPPKKRDVQELLEARVALGALVAPRARVNHPSRAP